MDIHQSPEMLFTYVNNVFDLSAFPFQQLIGVLYAYSA